MKIDNQTVDQFHKELKEKLTELATKYNLRYVPEILHYNESKISQKVLFVNLDMKKEQTSIENIRVGLGVTGDIVYILTKLGYECCTVLSVKRTNYVMQSTEGKCYLVRFSQVFSKEEATTKATAVGEVIL